MTSWAEERRLEALERDYKRQQAALERDRERQQALTVACPAPPFGCEAAVGEECRNVRTGKPLEHQVAHDRRRILAGQDAPDQGERVVASSDDRPLVAAADAECWEPGARPSGEEARAPGSRRAGSAELGSAMTRANRGAHSSPRS